MSLKYPFTWSSHQKSSRICFKSNANSSLESVRELCESRVNDQVLPGLRGVFVARPIFSHIMCAIGTLVNETQWHCIRLTSYSNSHYTHDPPKWVCLTLGMALPPALNHSRVDWQFKSRMSQKDIGSTEISLDKCHNIRMALVVLIFILLKLQKCIYLVCVYIATLYVNIIIIIFIHWLFFWAHIDILFLIINLMQFT